MTEKGKRLAVIGGGAAGLLAAGLCGEGGMNVTLFEKNNRVGRKLSITGKGRCNVTNLSDLNTFLSNVPTNPKFLYSAYGKFPPERVMEFFEAHGVPLKVERGNRVFPVSDKAADIVSALTKFCSDSGVHTLYETVRDVRYAGNAFSVITQKGTYPFDAVLIATGGKSYPLTGSDGDGYRFAASFGHTVTPLSPSLVPLVCREKACADMMGLSLKNVTLTATDTKTGKNIFHELGELLFTHFGVSGPLVLSASAKMKPMESGRYTLTIDMKPALDETTLDARILRDFASTQNKNISNALGALLPKKMIEPVLARCPFSPFKKVNEITKGERRALCDVIKHFPLTVERTRPISEAIITSGGVSVKEIDPKTMASKHMAGLYFAGEIIDVDAYTGGFNLQIAFCTAYTAAGAILARFDTHENAE